MFDIRRNKKETDLFDVKHYCLCMSISLAARRMCGVRRRSEEERELRSEERT